MRKKFVLTAVVILAVALGIWGARWFWFEKGEPVAFETVAQNWSSGHAERESYVITTGEEWNEMWLKFTANVTPFPPPEIDFNSSTIVAFFAGAKPTGGYEIEITEITETAEKVYVKVREISPGPRCIVAQMITEPYHIIQIPKTEKEVEFKLDEVVNKC